MARLLNMTMLLLIGVGLLVAGCGSDDDGDGDDAKGDGTSRGTSRGTVASTRGSGASTRADAGATAANAVLEALKSFKAAMLSGDKNDIAACIDGSDRHTEFFAALSEMFAVTTRYQDAMKAAYGADDVRGGKENPFAGEAIVTGVEIKIDGDTAVATKPDHDGLWKFVKKGGRWKMDAKSMVSEKEIERALSTMPQMKAMLEAQKRLMGKIGQPGYTAEKINEELGRAMAKAMGFPMRTPPTPTPPTPEPE